MDPFSVRQGHRPRARPKSSVSGRLKWRVWRLIDTYGSAERTFESVWRNWCGRPVEELHSRDDWRRGRSESARAELRGEYGAMPQKEWYRMYDLIELVYGALASDPGSSPAIHSSFAEDINAVLGEELSAWRLLGGRVVPEMDPALAEQAGAAGRQSRLHEKYVGRAILHMGPGSDNDLSISESVRVLEATLRQIGARGEP